jgi:hypothetical protein
MVGAEIEEEVGESLPQESAARVVKSTKWMFRVGFIERVLGLSFVRMR